MLDSKIQLSEVKLSFFPRCTITTTLPSHSLTALVGRNGSGKTTLLRAILGETVTDSGRITLGTDARDVRKLSAGDRARWFAFVPQEHQFPQGIDVRALLGFAFLPKLGLLRSLGETEMREISTVIEQFDLAKISGRRLEELSSGERQRTFLARAILQRPRILLLDEPTNHLDPSASRRFWDLLLSFRRNEECSIIVSTHDIDFVSKHSDWVLGLEEGRVAFSTPAEACARPLKSLFGL